jgi:Domain of unknown function (DUF4276)
MIQPIVEGHGEVQAVPVLFRKLATLMAVAYVEIGRPIRRTRTELVAKDRLAQAIELARLQPRCSGIFILFDADDDCPKTLAPQILKWANELARGIPAAVVMANQEFEAWFLHSLASLPRLRDSTPCSSDPERIRDAKGVLGERMRHGYSETTDQARLTAATDWAFVHKRSRSARKLIKEVRRLLFVSGLQPSSWPKEA